LEGGDEVKIITGIHQGHEAWDKLRAVRPTASEFSKIITGTGKASTQREAYMRKLAIATKYDLPQWQGNKWTDRGHELEPQARERFIEESGFDVREVAFIGHETTIAGGSPDGLIYNGDDEPVSGIEVKCFNSEKHLGILDKGVLPTENLAQVHGHLWLTGFDAWAFVIYCPEAFPLDFKVIEVKRSSYTDKLGEAVTKFCDELLERTPEFLADFEAQNVVGSVRSSMPNICAALDREEVRA
jgi:DNA-binding ferritin-like protein (Dps family)